MSRWSGYVLTADEFNRAIREAYEALPAWCRLWLKIKRWLAPTPFSPN